MAMAPPKRWARRSSVGAPVRSSEHAADSLLLSRETYTCPEKHTHVQRNIHGLETVDPRTTALRAYAALTVISLQSKQGGALSGVAPHVWRIVPTLASGTICARFGYYDVQMSTRRTHDVAPRKIIIPVEYSIVSYGCRNV